VSSSQSLPAPDLSAVSGAVSRFSVFEGYIGVLIVAFLVSVCVTPVLRRLAIANGVVDMPNQRKMHRLPVAYLGGVAIYLGILAGIFYSFLTLKFPDLIEYHPTKHLLDSDEAIRFPVPISILLGMTVIVLVGVIDDVTGISPRVKIGGQLFAAAALAVDQVGVRLAGGLLRPIGEFLGNPDLVYKIALGFTIPILNVSNVEINVVYWIGTGIIALGVLGLCNASNLIDGLDGLLTGTTAISHVGLLVVALGMAVADDGPRDAQRIILCLAVLGACLGFLPHNFNPAVIFLGDAGSLLLGFMTCVVIMMLGDTGKTHLVAAGLIIYALPIIDTSLAIVRRKMEGKPISAADDQHLHHMLKRGLGVRGAVLVLYGIAATFAVLGGSTSWRW
jgi:UDP-GlcNAc:undecaprenyl-phosphate/decaprenyl-phosphate GlcNAc-1-phosphate transferase